MQVSFLFKNRFYLGAWGIQMGNNLLTEKRNPVRAIYFSIFVILLGSSCSDNTKELQDKYAAASAYYDENNLPDAIRSFGKVYEEDSDYKSTRLMLGKCFFFSKDLKRAKAMFAEDYARDIKRLNSGIWWYRTRFILGEDPNEIHTGISGILEQDPEKTEGWIVKGLAEEKLGKIQQAAESYKKAIEISKRLGFANYRLSKVFEKIGIESRAEEYAAQAKALGYSDKSQ